MPQARVGLLGVVLYLVNACSSSSNENPQTSAEATGTSGTAGSTTVAPAHGGTNGDSGANSAGSTSGSGGTAGQVSVGAGGAIEGGTQNAGSGASGDLGGSQNIYIDQIALGQGGGPPKCLPRSLPIGPPNSSNDGRVTCLIAELKPGACDCSQTARAPLSASLLTTMRRQMKLTGTCDGNAGVSCDSVCGCEIEQTPGLASEQDSPLYACQNDLTVPAGVDGFCVIDLTRTDPTGAPAPLGNPDVVAQCPSNEKRILRFVGAGQPASGATAFIGCTN